MSNYAKIYLSNGKSYNVDHTPESIYKAVTHSDGRPMNHMHDFTLLKGGKVYVHAAHIVAVEEFEIENESVKHTVEEKNRKEANEEAAKEFKEDLDGNME